YLFFGIAGLFMAMCLSVRWKKDRRLQFSLALFSGRRSIGKWAYTKLLNLVNFQFSMLMMNYIQWSF
ncbi:hypothetical protein CUU02_12935, partial [Klebsiella pneumoniae]